MSITVKVKENKLGRMYVESRFDQIIQVGASDPQNKIFFFKDKQDSFSLEPIEKAWAQTMALFSTIKE